MNSISKQTQLFLWIFNYSSELKTNGLRIFFGHWIQHNFNSLFCLNSFFVRFSSFWPRCDTILARCWCCNWQILISTKRLNDQVHLNCILVFHHYDRHHSLLPIHIVWVFYDFLWDAPTKTWSTMLQKWHLKTSNLYLLFLFVRFVGNFSIRPMFSTSKNVVCNVQWLLFWMQPEISLFLLHKNGIHAYKKYGKLKSGRKKTLSKVMKNKNFIISVASFCKSIKQRSKNNAFFYHLSSVSYYCDETEMRREMKNWFKIEVQYE